MVGVHASAVIEGDVRLADDVAVGPGCSIDGTLGPVVVGSGTRLISGVYLHGPLKIGCRNVMYPQVCLGFAPQSRNYDPAVPGRGLVIGDDNIFREGVTIHRAMTDDGPTTVGNDNFFMANSHAGHDARIGDHCTFANGVLLAGHVIIDERVTIGGNATVHQFVHVGRGAMLSGSTGLTKDVPPFFMLTVNLIISLNTVGMRRQGLSADQLEDVKWVYKTLCRRGLTPPLILETLRQRAGRPLIAEYISFIEGSRRGVCTDRAQPKR